MQKINDSVKRPAPGRRAAVQTGVALIAGALLEPVAWAQKFPITAQQRSTAEQVAARGVPIAELAPNAPDSYVVKSGDTLWAISGIYLQRPWRWPQLWGMNLQAIANPHLIYPGQTLYLERDGAYARLRTGGPNETVRVSPRTRYESLAEAALPTLKPHLIEPFLVEPEVVDELGFEQAPRIVATTGERSIMTSGDRAYVRGPQGSPLELDGQTPRHWRIYRNTVPMKDPGTGEILGYEAQYVARAELVRGEELEQTSDRKGRPQVDVVPATIDISGAREEVRPGDRLLPLSKRPFVNYVPRAPREAVDARVVSIYGSVAVAHAGQNQVIAINRGAEDGMEVGNVLALLSGGQRIKDKTDAQGAMIRLPSEYNGLAMVFRTFERVSYALILQARDGVRVGDRLTQPQ